MVLQRADSRNPPGGWQESRPSRGLPPEPLLQNGSGLLLTQLDDLLELALRRPRHLYQVLLVKLGRHLQGSLPAGFESLFGLRCRQSCRLLALEFELSLMASHEHPDGRTQAE